MYPFFWCVAFTTTADQNLRLQLPVFDFHTYTAVFLRPKLKDCNSVMNECNKGLIFNYAEEQGLHLIAQ